MIGLVLSCEHASWTLPPGVDLGVGHEVLASQASWDHGALDIAARLGERLGVPVRAGRYSRMFVDLNRPPAHEGVIPTNSYGAPVPGNVGLDEAARAMRIAEHHRPYWDAVRRDCVARLDEHGSVLHLSSHSFAPELDPANRTFEVGVLYDPEHAFEAWLAERILFGLRQAGLDVRANQPYTGVGPALCTELRRGLAHPHYAGIEIETSHAVTHSSGGCARVASALLPIIEMLRAEDVAP